MADANDTSKRDTILFMTVMFVPLGLWFAVLGFGLGWLFGWV